MFIFPGFQSSPVFATPVWVNVVKLLHISIVCHGLTNDVCHVCMILASMVSPKNGANLYNLNR